jgi:hypothetical protein
MCRVISTRGLDGKRKLLVHSDDYDEFLSMEWAYYKGLESALTRGEYFRVESNPQSRGSLTAIAEALAKKKGFREFIPPRYRDRFKKRPIKGEDVLEMLTGIIQREAESERRYKLENPTHKAPVDVR